MRGKKIKAVIAIILVMILSITSTPITRLAAGENSNGTINTESQMEETTSEQANDGSTESITENISSDNTENREGTETADVPGSSEKGQFQTEGTNGSEESLFSAVRSLFSMMVQPLGTATGKSGNVSEDYYKGGTSTGCTLGSNLPSGFDVIELEVLSKAEGYTNVDEDAFVRVSGNVFMDEVYLYQESDRLMEQPDFPKQGALSEKEWFDAIMNWFTATPSAPVLTFVYDLGEGFTDASVPETEISSENAGDISIGSYQVKAGQLIIKMNTLLFFMNNIEFSFSADLAIDKDILTSDPQKAVIQDDGQIIFERIFSSEGGGDTEGISSFRIGKKAPVKVSDTTITYLITAEALPDKDNQITDYLNGKTISDEINQDFKIVSFTMKEKNGVSVADGTVSYQTDGNILHYTFEEQDQMGNPANAITSAVLELVIDYTDTAYSDLITAGGVNKVYTNRASLNDSTAGKTLAESKDAVTKMNISFISKTGKSTNLQGTRFQWEVTLNTKLPSMEYGYFADTLCWTDQTYDFTEGITITTDDGQETVKGEDIVRLTGSLLMWKELTAQGIQAMVAASDNPDAKAFYYIVGTDADSPFGGKMQTAVLILPYEAYRGITESKKVSVSYSTDMNQHGLTEKAYAEILLGTDTGTPYTPDTSNYANLLWVNTGGIGPNPVPQDDVTFGKKVNTNLNPVYKYGVSYDEKSQKLTWGIDVNKLGISLTNVSVKDKIRTDVYQKDSLKLRYIKYDTGAGTVTGPMELSMDSSTGMPYYTLSDADADHTEITIHIGDMPRSQSGYIYYTIFIDMIFADPGLLKQQTDALSALKAQNSVTLNSNYNGSPYNRESTAGIAVPNTLIKKEAVGDYNYLDGTFTWVVTVNPNQLNLTEAVVTDTLPEGFTYETLTAVSVDGETVSDSDLQTLAGKADTSKPGEVSFPLGNLTNRTYRLTYTTKATDTWRYKNLEVKTDNNGNIINGDSVITVINQAALSGIIKNEGTQASVDPHQVFAKASNTIRKKPISKSGIYHEKDGSISWTVILNEDSYNIAGLRLEEEIIPEKQEESAVHELDYSSVKVEVLDRTTGNYEPVSTQTAAAISTLPGRSAVAGFSFTVPSMKPDGTNDHTYRMTFLTYLTQKAERSPIRNRVRLMNSSGDIQEVSGESDGGYKGGFDYKKIAQASSRPRILIRKISENSADKAEELHSYALTASFELSAYEFTVDSASHVLSVGNKQNIYDKKKIVAGNDYILNILPSDSRIYVLHETTEAKGYQLEKKPLGFYYFPTTANGSLDSVVSVAYTSDGSSENYGTDLLKIEKPKDGAYSAIPITITNKPKNDSFTFKKQVADKTGYTLEKDKNDQLAYTDAGLNAVKFLVEPTGALKGKVHNQVISSDASGKFVLSGLDPGTYSLKEVQSPEYSSCGGTLTLKVEYDETADENIYRISNPANGIKMDTVTDPTTTILKDDLSRGSFSFTKYVRYSENKDKGQDTEILPGVSFVLTGKVLGSAVENYERIESSDKDGKVRFDKLPVGTYVVTERIPEGYRKDANTADPWIYKFNVAEADNPQDPEWGYTSKKVVTEITGKNEAYYGTGNITDQSGSYAVYNTPVTGTISLRKELSDKEFTGAGGALPGAEFGLFRVLAGKVAATPSYTTISTAVMPADDRTIPNVVFGQVDYGTYVIKELKEPFGCTKIKTAIEIGTIGKGDLTLMSGAGKNTFSDIYGKQADGSITPVTNELAKMEVEFQKTDNNGQPLKGIAFAVYRRGTIPIGVNGSGLVPKVSANVKNYYTYGPKERVMSDAAGMVTLSGLPYGDYLLVEETPADAQTGYRDVALLLSINELGEVVFKDNQAFQSFVNGDEVDTTGADWKPLNDQKLVNKLKYGFVNINKMSGEAEYHLDGKKDTALSTTDSRRLANAVFQIYQGTKVSGTPYLTLMTNESGNFEPAKEGSHQGAYRDLTHTDAEVYKYLLYGTYTIVETKAPEGFVKNDTPVTFTLSEENTGQGGTAWISLNERAASVSYQKNGANAPDVSAVNEVQRNRFTIKKIDMASPSEILHGAVFTVYDGAIPVAELHETDHTGIYRLTDQKAAGGTYHESRNVSGVNLTYLHQTENGFHLLTGTYRVEETSAPEDFIPAEPITVVLKAKEVLVSGSESIMGSNHEITLPNRRETRFFVSKEDETGKGLSGAKLQIYEWSIGKQELNQSNPIKTWVSDGSAYEVIGLPETTGDIIYYIWEEGRIPGYREMEPKDRIYFTLQKEVNGKTLLTLTDADGRPLINAPDTSDNHIHVINTKVVADIILRKEEEQGLPVPGIVFELSDAGEKVIDTRTTDNNGEIRFDKIPEGTYTVRENGSASEATAPSNIYLPKMPEKFKVEVGPKDKEVKVNKSGVVVNQNYSSTVKLVKVDGESPFEKLSGAVFQLEYFEETKNTFVTVAVNTNSTDRNGVYRASLMKKGIYRLTETAAPQGYELGEKPFCCIFEAKNDDFGKEVVISKGNKALTIQSGASLLLEEGVANIRKTGSVTLTKQDGVTDEELAGVTFTLYKKQAGNWLKQAWNFITGKGYVSVQDEYGSELAEKGKLVIHDLAWGDYKLVETASLPGYVIDETPLLFTIGKMEHDYVFSVDKGTIKNVMNQLIIEKHGSDLVAGAAPLDGAVFQITNKNDERDSFITKPTRNGRVTITGQLTGGETYVLKELTPPECYFLNEEEIIFVMGKDGIIRIGGHEQKNNQILISDDPTEISFTKGGRYKEECADNPADLEALFGVEFTIYKEEEPDIPLMTAKSDQNGIVRFQKLPQGTYLIRETGKLPGYVANDTIYYAQITQTGFYGLTDSEGVKVQDNTVINDVIRTTIHLKKVNEQNPEEPVPGSTYGLYKKTAVLRQRLTLTKGVTSYQQEGLVLVATATTDKNGILEFAGVLMNTEYTIRELIAPDGSYQSELPITIRFNVNDNGTVFVSELTDGKGTAVIDPVTGAITWKEPPVEVEFRKTDENGRLLAGAVMQVLDADNTVIEEWTSDAASPYLSSQRLTAGKEYYLTEKTAPAGYKIAKPIAFTVPETKVGPNENLIFTVTMVDEKENVTPDTGGNQNHPDTDSGSAPEISKTSAANTGDRGLPAITVLMLLTGFACLIVSWRKRKQK